MANKELPILTFGPFRKYPTKRSEQVFSDVRQVCHACVSGACCTNQDAIALNSFDIFRFATYFNMSPAEFMLNFTQDEFDGEAKNLRREGWNENPHSSVVTWLRRRENFAASPCIFLKYIRDADGTPHRICSVHDGRPLSCREYYFSHCKTRGTGELAALLAEGFEKVRDGEITEAMVDSQLARYEGPDISSATIAESFEYSFWVEMKCALNLDQANIEGSNSYDMAAYQDSIEKKLNRVISSKYLRFEERYGLEPRDEQLMPYTSGLSFAGSAEYERIMKVVHTPPSLGLFRMRNFPYYTSIRTLMPGVRHAKIFPTIPDRESNSFIKKIPAVLLFPNHDLSEVQQITLRDVYVATLKALNHLIRFSSHIVALDPILEHEAPGTLERQLISGIASFETALNSYIARNPYLQPVKEHLACISIKMLEEELAKANAEEVFDCFRSLQPLQRVKATLSSELQTRMETLQKAILGKLRKSKVRRYLNFENPIEVRRLAGKSLGVRKAWQAWSEWYGQMLDMRYAGLAGFTDRDIARFYRQSIDDLEKLPFRRDYAVNLLEAAKYLAHGMTGYNDIPYQAMEDKKSADRLAIYGINIFNRLAQRGENIHDYETTAEFLAAIYKGLGLSYNHDRNFGLIVYRLLESQLPDGSWDTNPLPEEIPGSQGEFLERMYRITCACVPGLVPLRNDILNAENSALGLI
jgi:Fe-S-cluster containining protein